MKKKFVIAGTSARGLLSYGRPLAELSQDIGTIEQFDYGNDSANIEEILNTAELVGVFDINIGRATYVGNELGVPAYADFDQMLEDQKPDCIIVTSADYSHAEYIVRGLDLGYEVWAEKPMCITADQCRSILEAEKRNDRKIGVCFNMRYMNNILQIKEIIDSGVLGTIYNVNFEWLLTKDYTAGHSGHGASYYRRWNAYMEKSGGLLLTKSTHHFDMINWFINGRPKRVSAFGRLREYGKNGSFRGERCSTCAYTQQCQYHYNISDFNQKMFVDHEQYDGYKIDRCVYDEAIDTYDTMNLIVEYTNGVLMSYSESSAAMYEGFKLFINGSDARLEVQSFSSGGVRSDEHPDYIRIIKPGSEDENITVIDPAPALTGSHGGADDAMKRVLFLGEEPEFEYQKAGSIDGAYSILIGAAANESIKTGKIIDIDELIGDASLLDR